MGGIRTALDLAEAGKNVVLVDTANAIGGLMTQLDRTFPTNNCDLCTFSPNMSEGKPQPAHRTDDLDPGDGLEGEAGDFTATLTTRPGYIDVDQCTACGECHKKYPECVDFSPGLDHRAPTCMRYPQATPQAFSIDMEKCTDKEALTACCPAGAIMVDDRPAAGAKALRRRGAGHRGQLIFDPGKSGSFRLRNRSRRGHQPGIRAHHVGLRPHLRATGPAFRRTGPEKDRLDSVRGLPGHQQGAAPYCSSVCCMYALKEAIVTKERFQDDIETTIFYMDMRTFGKDYELYYETGRNEYGIRFVRSRPHSIIRKPGDEQLTVTYAPYEESHL